MLTKSFSTEFSTQSELTIEDSAPPPVSRALTDMPDKWTLLEDKDDDLIMESPAQPAVQPSPPPSIPEFRTDSKESMTMMVEGSLLAPPSCSERISPLPTGNPSHSRASVETARLPQIIAAPIEEAHTNQKQPRVVEKDDRDQRLLESPQFPEQPMIIPEPSQMESLISKVPLSVKRLKPLKEAKQMSESKEESRTAGPASGEFCTEEDDDQRSSSTSTIISVNASQLSAFRKARRSQKW